jgi:hypothetical protein
VDDDDDDDSGFFFGMERVEESGEVMVKGNANGVLKPNRR